MFLFWILLDFEALFEYIIYYSVVIFVTIALWNSCLDWDLRVNRDKIIFTRFKSLHEFNKADKFKIISLGVISVYTGNYIMKIGAKGFVFKYKPGYTTTGMGQFFVDSKKISEEIKQNIMSAGEWVG